MEQFYFVLAPNSHGATVLAHLLNNHSAVSCLGDTMPRTEYDQNCGCGSKVSACEFWRYIGVRFADSRLSFPHRMYPRGPYLSDNLAIEDALVQSLSLAALLTTRGLWQLAGGAAEKYVRFYREFIKAVNEWNGASIYISGQKSLQQVLAIKSILGRDAKISIIHLVRDPRGYACSDRRLKPENTVKTSARNWFSYHSRVLRVVRPLCRAEYLAVRYEDLCLEPEATMRRLFDFVGVEYQDPFFQPRNSHLMGSRANRTFTGKLQHSETWRSILAPDEQRMCLQLTMPLSERYGYVEQPLASPA